MIIRMKGKHEFLLSHVALKDGATLTEDEVRKQGRALASLVSAFTDAKVYEAMVHEVNRYIEAESESDEEKAILKDWEEAVLSLEIKQEG